MDRKLIAQAVLGLRPKFAVYPINGLQIATSGFFQAIRWTLLRKPSSKSRRSALAPSESAFWGSSCTSTNKPSIPTAAAARILKLTPRQTLHALALAFNRCGGSFQSHVDGSLGVRFVQGWVAERV